MGAGASSKGKSPGSTAPTVPTPPQIGQIGQNLGNLGLYESQFINQPWSLGNWAMNLATGGTGPQATQNLSQGPQTGLFGPTGAAPGVPSSVVQTYGGGTGGGGGPTGTSTINPFGGGPGGTGGGGTGYGNLPGFLGGFGAGENAAWNTANTPYPATSPTDFISTVNDIWGQEAAIAASEKGLQQSQAQIQRDISQFGPNWLTPAQNTAINQQTAANQAQLAQQEGSMGLSGSTQAAQLAGETAQAGIANRAQIQAQNMQLVQGWQKLQQGEQGLVQGAQGLIAGEQGLMQGAQGLSLAAQQQAFNQFQQFAQLNATEQAQMFSEGTAGYQLMQTFMSAVLEPYAGSLNAFNDELIANTAQVGDQVALQSTAISADQSGQNQVIGSIGSLLSSLVKTA